MEDQQRLLSHHSSGNYHRWRRWWITEEKLLQLSKVRISPLTKKKKKKRSCENYNNDGLFFFFSLALVHVYPETEWEVWRFGTTPKFFWNRLSFVFIFIILLKRLIIDHILLHQKPKKVSWLAFQTSQD